MDDNDKLVAIFPTHEVTVLFHSPELRMDKELLEYMQSALALGLSQGMTPLATFYRILPPYETSAEDVDEALAAWSGDGSA